MLKALIGILGVRAMQTSNGTERNKENATAMACCVAAIENARTTKTELELFIDLYCMPGPGRLHVPQFKPPPLPK